MLPFEISSALTHCNCYRCRFVVDAILDILAGRGDGAVDYWCCAVYAGDSDLTNQELL